MMRGNLILKIWVPVFFVGLGALFVATGMGASWMHKQYTRLLPDVSILQDHYPVALGKQGTKNLYTFQKARPSQWKTLKQISKKVVRAVLTAEDGHFYEHHGYDPKAIEEAIRYNMQPGTKIKRGGSTITQQVVKNLFLTPEKTISRKLRELILAVDLEHSLTKNKILEVYLNIAEWGPGVYGVEQASKKYFHKSVEQLSAQEGAILAFMLPNPKRYQFSYQNGQLTSFGASRVDDILQRMHKIGYITDEEYSQILHPPQDEAEASSDL